MRRFRLLSAIL